MRIDISQLNVHLSNHMLKRLDEKDLSSERLPSVKRRRTPDKL